MIARFACHEVPPRQITAPEPDELGVALRALSDQRLNTFRQSLQTTQGRRAEYDPDPVSPEEVAEAYQLKYGVSQ